MDEVQRSLNAFHTATLRFLRTEVNRLAHHLNDGVRNWQFEDVDSMVRNWKELAFHRLRSHFRSHSDQLDVVSFDSNRYRSPEQLHRYDDALLPTLPNEDPFYAIERASTNAHTLSDVYEGMHGTWDLSIDRRLEILDLFMGNRSSLLLISHKGKHARSPQYVQPLLCRLGDVDECIAAEHGNFDFAPPVGPLPDFVEQRKKRVDVFFPKLPGNPLFMSRLGLNCVPVRFLRYVT